MKKVFTLLMLLAGINQAGFGQEDHRQTKEDKVFDVPPNHSHRRFIIDIGKGNKMQIEVSSLDDLRKYNNADSVIRTVLKDVFALKDSSWNELWAKRIDYTVDSAGRKNIRFQQFKPKGTNYIVDNGEPAALKLEQDTLHILGTVHFTAKYTLRKAFETSRTYRISFFVNDINDLASYTDGRLNIVVANLLKDIEGHWGKGPGGMVYLESNKNISAKKPHGFIAGGDFLVFRASVDVQNYKQYFVPSFSLGAGVILASSYFKRDIVLSWDPQFLFARNAQGNLKTYRNDFLTLTWGQGMIKDNNPAKESHFLFIASFSYLYYRQGEFYDKGTMRLGAGRLSLFQGKTKIEPGMYFTNLFRGVTPALRIVQSF